MRAENKIVFARLDRHVAHGHAHRKTPAFELRPLFTAISRDVEAELRAEEQQIRLHEIFFDDVRVPADAAELMRTDEWRPGLPEIGRLE